MSQIILWFIVLMFISFGVYLYRLKKCELTIEKLQKSIQKQKEDINYLKEKLKG